MDKKQLIQTLNVLKQQRKYEDFQYDTLSKVFGGNMEPYKNELFDEIVDILEALFPKTVWKERRGSDISLFVYEYDFGESFKIGDVVDAGVNVDWSDIDKFADYVFNL